MQSRYYDTFKRSLRTPDKLSKKSQSEETDEPSDNGNEETLGKRGAKKRKTFGLIEARNVIHQIVISNVVSLS